MHTYTLYTHVHQNTHIHARTHMNTHVYTCIYMHAERGRVRERTDNSF